MKKLLLATVALVACVSALDAPALAKTETPKIQPKCWEEKKDPEGPPDHERAGETFLHRLRDVLTLPPTCARPTSPNHHFRLATRGRSIQKDHEPTCE
jgi:hypothetical protein